jgi:hypothetical protein
MRTLAAALALGLAACAAPAASKAPPRSTSAACAGAAPDAGRGASSCFAKLSTDELPRVASCEGLSEEDRRTNLFKHELVAAEPLRGEHRIGGRIKVERPLGARLVVAASPDTNGPWLERLTRCQVDTYAALGQAGGADPLGVPGARVQVQPVHGGYAVDVTADDWDAAREIQARATSLRR